MMESWIELRKDVFVRNLYQEFLEATIFFDTVLASYQETSSVPFKLMDGWVGTESKKGPLWLLKDRSHRLFRNTLYHGNLYEYLFDWTMGSIFHEAMKLKEDAYQVESYKPLLELEVTRQDKNEALSSIISEYFSLIEKANDNLSDELTSISELFSKGIFHLREIFISRKENVLLLRFLLDKGDMVLKVFGEHTFLETLQRMFPDNLADAYITAAASCIKSGRFTQAEDYLKVALTMAPDHSEAVRLMNETKAKLSDYWKEPAS